MTILLTGGTGFVGRELIDKIEDCVLTSRNATRAQQKLEVDPSRIIQWDPENEPLELSDKSHFTAVINLMGDSIAEGRWTSSKKLRIRNSRVEGTRKLVDALLARETLPSVFVSASAIGIYGDSGEDVVDESHPHGSGFLTDVCEEWEAETTRLSERGVRVVCMRIGLVIGSQGGVIGKLAPIFRWGIGGPLGNGKQWMSWIHVQDLVSQILWTIKTEAIQGPLNATSPNPVRNREFTQSLAKAVGRPAFIPVPKFGLRIGVGEFANSLFFSQRVVPKLSLEHGFQFRFNHIDEAIQDVLASS
ncbi:MAG: hypothetical protein ACI814_002973 [Mariniblastus sp.]|jgi:uncharacterized protein (TIGR01777 family)